MSETPDLPVAGSGGMPDLGSLLAAAEKMGEQLMASQAEAAKRVVTGTSGGGAVTVEVNGSYEFSSITISPVAVDPDDIEMLQDLVLAAINDAMGQLGEGGEGGGVDLGGLDLGGLDLGGLLGGASE